MPVWPFEGQYDSYDVRDYLLVDHNYTKPWHTAPNTILRMPAKFLLRSREDVVGDDHDEMCVNARA
jgi:hypothetical protein